MPEQNLENHKITILKNWLIILLLSLSSQCLLAQGDGPRGFLLSPAGLWGINAKWINLNQNLLPSGNILVKDAEIKVNVFPTTVFHTFGIKGRFAQVVLMVNPGYATGTIEPDQPGIPAPDLNASGIADGVIGMKIGLIGAPSLNIAEFANHAPAFSLMGYFRLWYSGNYNSEQFLNMGTNRFTFEFGFPMSMPLYNSDRHTLWLEVFPSVQFFTTNNDPTIIAQAEESHQLPLFLIENHLTYNVIPKLWAGIDLRYQYGGELELDGEKQDNRNNILGGGVSAGYQLFPFLSGSASYGSILFGDNGAESQMIRISLVFVYANTKKIKGQ